jgi:hypothetical protein
MARGSRRQAFWALIWRLPRPVVSDAEELVAEQEAQAEAEVAAARTEPAERIWWAEMEDGQRWRL